MPLTLRALALTICVAGTASGQTADTLSAGTPLFSARDALLIGGFALGGAVVAPADEYLARELQKSPRQTRALLRNSATGFRILGFPGAFVAGAGIYLVGRIDGQRRLEDLGLHAVEAMAVGTFVTGTIKTVAGRARPHVDIGNSTNFAFFRGWRNDDYRSFPSGHTTLAFAFASIVSSETVRWRPGSRWVVGPIVYSAATLAGVSRMYNNQHWASDIVAGAAVGTFTGLKVFRYQHSHPGNALDKTFLRAGIELPNTGGWMPHLSLITR